jgi:transposase-like protein
MASNNTAKSAKKQHTPAEIIQFLRGFEDSEGLSVRAYCEKIGVNTGTFHYWRKKFGEAPEPQTDFIPLEITGIPQPEASLQMEVKVIKIYGHLCLEQLKAILS